MIAIGISGNHLGELIIDSFVWNKGAAFFNNLNLHEILSVKEYRNVLLEHSGQQFATDNAAKMNEKARKLGIVLTPCHVTELFCDLAEISASSKVVDICVGTEEFLTAAWKMVKYSDLYTLEEKERFRNNNLFGVEKEKSIYTIIALNMFINKDGRSHIYKGDCFSLVEKVREFECNTGIINPPYSDAVYSEIEFVELMLDVLLPESTGIAIVPINAISSRTKKHSGINSVKKRILQKHKLVASIQMPVNLFYPKGTETIILVFRADEAHMGSAWFVKFDDGYELIKHQKTRMPGESTERKFH